MRVHSYAPTALVSRARSVYIGKSGMDPVDNPVALYYDPEHTRRAPNPFPLLNGFNAFRGAQSAIFAKESVSLLVADEDDVALYKLDDASMYEINALIDAMLVQINLLLVLNTGDVMTGPLSIGDAASVDDLYSRDQLDALLNSIASATYIIKDDASLALFVQNAPGYDFSFTYVMPGTTSTYIEAVAGKPVKIPKTCIRLWSESFSKGKLIITSSTLPAPSGDAPIFGKFDGVGFVYSDIVQLGCEIQNLSIETTYDSFAGIPVNIVAVYVPNCTLSNCTIGLTVNAGALIDATVAGAIGLMCRSAENIDVTIFPSTSQLAPTVNFLALIGVNSDSTLRNGSTMINCALSVRQANTVRLNVAQQIVSVVASYIALSRRRNLNVGDHAIAAINTPLTIVEIDGTLNGDLRKCVLAGRYGVSTSGGWIRFNGDALSAQASRKPLLIFNKFGGGSNSVHFRNGAVSNTPLRLKDLLSVQTSFVNGRIDDCFKVNNSHLKIKAAVAQVSASIGFGVPATIITGTDGTWLAFTGIAASNRWSIDDGATWNTLAFSAAPTNGFMPNRGWAFAWAGAQVWKIVHNAQTGLGAVTALPVLPSNVIGMFTTLAGNNYVVTDSDIRRLDIVNNLWIVTPVVLANIVAFSATGDGVIGIVTTTSFYRIFNGDDVNGNFVASLISNVPAGTFKQLRRGRQVDWYYLTDTKLYRSSDNGATWTTLYTAPVNTTFSAFDLDEVTEVITIAGQVTTPTLFVANSPDGGVTWNTSTPTGVTAFDIKTNGAGTWFVSSTDATGARIGKSTDDAVSFGWTAYPAPTVGGRSIAADGKGVWLIGTASINFIREIIASYQSSYFSHDNSVPAANSAAGGWNS